MRHDAFPDMSDAKHIDREGSSHDGVNGFYDSNPVFGDELDAGPARAGGMT
jgi:hypothetical protein